MPPWRSLVSWVAALTSRPVVRGLVLGLGLSFILEGVTLMHSGPAVAIAGAALTSVLLSQSRLPAMLVLLVYGGVAALVSDSALVGDLTGCRRGSAPTRTGSGPRSEATVESSGTVSDGLHAILYDRPVTTYFDAQGGILKAS